MPQAATKVSALATKSMESPDERRTPSKSVIDVAHLEGYTLGRLTFQPGWRWSECIKPVVGTASCQSNHLGYAIAGRLTVRLEDGTEQPIAPGDLYSIPPGHDAWVDGSEPFVGLEIMSAEEYARPS